MRTPGESEVGVLGVLEIGEWRGRSSQQSLAKVKQEYPVSYNGDDFIVHRAWLY